MPAGFSESSNTRGHVFRVPGRPAPGGPIAPMKILELTMHVMLTAQHSDSKAAHFSLRFDTWPAWSLVPPSGVYVRLVRRLALCSSRHQEPVPLTALNGNMISKLIEGLACLCAEWTRSSTRWTALTARRASVSLGGLQASQRYQSRACRIVLKSYNSMNTNARP